MMQQQKNEKNDRKKQEKNVSTLKKTIQPMEEPKISENLSEKKLRK